MDGWIGGWGMDGQQPDGSPTPGRRQHLELDPGAASASRRSPSRPARPPFLPPVHPPPDPTHQPTTSPQTLTRWTMLSTQDNQKHNLAMLAQHPT